MVSLSYIPTENFYLMSFFLGFESILEGLLGPELLEDLKLFKGKCQFFFFYCQCVLESTSIIKTQMTIL